MNVSDGFVEAGNIPNSNSSQGQWETDERFEGFNSIINWFLTWDDNNLYVGKIGGNNAQGSLIFIRANYDSSTYSNHGIIYDNFNPDFSLMNGINFSAYIKDSLDDIRTLDKSRGPIQIPRFYQALAFTQMATTWKFLFLGTQ